MPENETPLLLSAQEFVKRVKAGEDWYEMWAHMPTNGAFDAAFTGNVGYGRAAVMFKQNPEAPEWTIVAQTTPPSSEFPMGDWEILETRGDIIEYLKEHPPFPAQNVGKLFEFAEGIDYQLPWLLFLVLIGERSLRRDGGIRDSSFTKPKADVATTLSMVPLSEKEAEFMGNALLDFAKHPDTVRPYTMILDYYAGR